MLTSKTQEILLHRFEEMLLHRFEEMLLSRPAAAVCAACIAHTAVFPIDTLRTRALVGTTAAGNLYDGVRVSTISRALGTGVFMQVYELGLASHMPVGVSATLASMTSSVPVSLLDVVKKQRQTRRLGVVNARRRVALYALHAVNHVPRACIQYMVYERVMRVLRSGGMAPSHAGGLAAAIASGLAVAILFPLERLRAQCVFGASIPRKPPAHARFLSVAQTLTSNGIGHARLKNIAPR